jgi:hypothetical protein
MQTSLPGISKVSWKDFLTAITAVDGNMLGCVRENALRRNGVCLDMKGCPPANEQFDSDVYLENRTSQDIYCTTSSTLFYFYEESHHG